MLRLAFAMDPARTRHVLPSELLTRLGKAVEILDDRPLVDFSEPRAVRVMADAEILLTGWGCPPIDAAALARLPKLRLVAHAAGTVKYFLSDAVFEAGIAVTQAAEANARPVAEFTLAMIILAGKEVFRFRDLYVRDRGRAATDAMLSAPIGNFRRTVGVVGASRIGRQVIELLKPLDLDVILHDPFVDAGEAERLGVRPVGLDALMAESDIVSLHAPSLPSTRHMIDARRLSLMRDGATLINTARGAIVDEAALLSALESGRISAVIDVTDPEIPAPDSRFYTLPNVFLTPHVAGAIGLERARLGLLAVEEIERFAAGAPLLHRVDPAMLGVMA